MDPVALTDIKSKRPSIYLADLELVLRSTSKFELSPVKLPKHKIEVVSIPEMITVELEPL